MEVTWIAVGIAILVVVFVVARMLHGSRHEAGSMPGTPRSSPPKPRAGDHVALRREIDALLNQGRKIDAIKIVRERTGWDLKEAKDFVETQERAGQAAAAVPLGKLPRDIDSEVRRLVAAGKKIDAIKLVRERTGLGLNEAKDLVDGLG
jgi:ribosomal protein L7/L12